MDHTLDPIDTKNPSDSRKVYFQPAQLHPQATPRSCVPVESSDDVLEVLTSNPDPKTLENALSWLKLSASARDEFNILKPGPKAAKLVFVLVDEIIPHYWTLLGEGNTASARKSRQCLLRCLRSTVGCGAIASCLRSYIDELKCKGSRTDRKRHSKIQPAETLINAFESLLSPDDFLFTLWKDAEKFSSLQSSVTFLWREVVSLFGSGKVLSLVGEASHVLNGVSSDIKDPSWIGQGCQYASWLGKNLRMMVDNLKILDEETSRKAISQMVGKALMLGCSVEFIEAAYSRLLYGEESLIPQSTAILINLAGYERRMFLYSLIRVLSFRQLDHKCGHLRGAAAVLFALCVDVPSLQDQLIDWLIGTSPEAVGQSHTARRTVVLALTPMPDRIKDTLWKTFDLFSDKLFIKHAPILHQEVNTQILLMLAGHAHRKDQTFLSTVSKSSVYLSGISNHLAASSPRARFLGMVVGSTISEMLDEPGKQLKFKAEDSESAEWRWYKDLISLDDQIGSIADLKPVPTPPKEMLKRKVEKQTLESDKSGQSPTSPEMSSRVIKIEEIDEDPQSEDEDMPVYAKPDSDPSDDDEDPTLVQRNKPTAPVYIRDLISGLKDTEDFDKHTLALKNASSLIRRKAAFGTEVTDHIEELATILVGLKDRWEFEDFTKLRLQAMQAVLVADPLPMGQWFSKAFYNGDYSLGQRVSILTTLGLGAREIAGTSKDDGSVTGAVASTDPFPSKRLPNKLHNLYALEAAPTNIFSAQMEKAMIQPLAASAADKVTGPNALKVRTFSSRIEVEKKRQKPLSNALAKIVTEGFFFPLTGRWQVRTQAFRNNAPQSSPLLLSHLLKTLSLIIHAAGPSTLALPQLTAEFWSFLLSIRSSGSALDPSVLEALLFAFLTLLDVNADNQRRLAEENAKELLETQEWAGNLLEKLGSGDEEGERCRMLAAGILVRCREVVEKYQRLLMGDLVDFL